jgi:putative transposase
MARLPRFDTTTQPQHVIQRGNNKSRLFESTRDYLEFKDCLKSAIQLSPCQLHAYVLMPNHVHLLVSPGQAGAIGKLMQSVGGRYVRYFNDRNGRTGTLWEGRYRATVIDSDVYFFACSRYIEENPVRAALAPTPTEYRWSSFAANALGDEDALLTPHELYLSLGTSPESREWEYRALFRDAIDRAQIAAIRDATNHGWALGGTRFQKTVNGTRRASRIRTSRCPIRCMDEK